MLIAIVSHNYNMNHNNFFNEIIIYILIPHNILHKNLEE